jgi:hypothetical protein
MDITQALPRVSRVDRARPAVIFIVARGKEEKIVELRAEDAGRMVAAINRHTFAYTENTILQEYTLLNPSLSLSELLFREEDLLRGIVDRSENYLCTAPDPHGFFPLMEPAVR